MLLVCHIHLITYRSHDLSHFIVSLSAAKAVANAAYEQMACPTHGISDEIAHILSGAFSQVWCLCYYTLYSLLSTVGLITMISFQRCIFIGCALSDALQDGSGGISMAQPIHLDSACNNKRFTLQRLFFWMLLLHNNRHTAFLIFLYSAGTDSVADAARTVHPSTTTMRAFILSAISLVCYAV